MAKYTASPHYAVGSIRFDVFGRYETENSEEIAELDALVPTWIKSVDEPVHADKPEVSEAPADDKPARTRKGATASGK